MDQNKETIVIAFPNHSIHLNFSMFEDDVDVDQLTQIDFTNIYAEIITISPLMNRVGMWKAEADNAEGEARLARNIKMAQIADLARKAAVGKKPTVGEISDIVTLDPAVQNLQRIRLRKGKEAGYLDSLYWAVKSKEMRLKTLGAKLVPEEFESNLIEGVWNGIVIRTKKNLIG